MHTNDYFVRREPLKEVDYEQSYWGTVVDPDGNVRDRLRERQKHLEDIAQELAFLNSLPGGKILDVGCGLGYLLSGLKPEWESHGLEVSQFAAEHARKWGKIHVGTLEEAGYGKDSFDAVVMHHVIEHIEDPVRSIKEVHRILKPGGILVLATPDFDNGVARRFGSNYRLLHDPTHISLFSNESMRRFLADHGFRIERVEYPFFETRYFTEENLLRLFDTKKVSPPFYGNFMTFYCLKPRVTPVTSGMLELSRLAAKVADELDSQVQAGAEMILGCLERGGKVLACGNDGNAADAQHFTADFVGRMTVARSLVQVLSLAKDPTVVAALGNDCESEHVLAHQVQSLGRAGDLLLCITIRGISPEILAALQAARCAGMKTVLLTSASPAGDIDCDVCIKVPSQNTQRIQELHLVVLHSICEHVDQRLTEKHLRCAVDTNPDQRKENS